MPLFFTGLLCGLAMAMSRDPNVISLVHPHGGEAHATLEDAAGMFMSINPGVTVDIIQGGWGNLMDTILANHSKGEGADIVTVGSTWASDFYDKGILTSITDYMDQWRSRRQRRGDIRRDFVRFLDFTYMFPGDKGSGSSVPVWYVLPLDVGTRVFFYRKDLFKKYLKRDRGPLTLKEAIEDGYYIMMKERERGNVNMSGFGVPAGGGASGVMQVLQSFVLGNGSSFIGSGEKCTFETDDFRASLWAYTHLYEGIQSGFPGQHTFPSGSSGDLARAFSRGELAMFAGAGWLEGGLYREGLTQEQLGVSLIPAGPIAPFTFQGGSGWAIPSYVPQAKRDLVWSFIEFMMEPSRGYLKYMTFGAGLLPAYESVTRFARSTHGDTFSMSHVQFRNGGQDVDMTKAAVWLGAETHERGVGLDHESYPRNLVTQGADFSISFNTTSPLIVTFVFPHSVLMDTYIFTTASRDPELEPTPEYDPVFWTMQVMNASAMWQDIHINRFGGNMPLRRSTAVPFDTVMDNVHRAHTGTQFRFIFDRVRGTFCGATCERTFAQLPFAVPLQYPQQGFYKIGRIEANGTLQRLVQRVHNGTSIEVATALGCAEVAVILRDPVVPFVDDSEDSMMLVLVLVVCFVFVLCAVVGGFGVHRIFYARRTEATITKLRSNNEMAEDLAKAVALMDLDEVQYLFSLDNPTRIQAAFIMIVSMMKQYRAYLPAALLVKDCDDEALSASENGSVCHPITPSPSSPSSPSSPTSLFSDQEPLRDPRP